MPLSAYHPLASILFLFLVVCPTHSQSAPLVFAPSQTHCSAGTAQSQPFFYPHAPIHCTAQPPLFTHPQCHVPSFPLYTFFFRIYAANIVCPSPSSISASAIQNGKCVLDYNLDFTLPAVFVLGFVTTALCGVMLAAAMYMAVGRIMHDYYQSLNKVQQERQKEEDETNALYSMIPPLPRGYGSFGRRLDVIGGWDGSFSSLVGMEEGQAEGEREGGQGENGTKGHKGDGSRGTGWDGWQEQLYFG